MKQPPRKILRTVPRDPTPSDEATEVNEPFDPAQSYAPYDEAQYDQRGSRADFADNMSSDDDIEEVYLEPILDPGFDSVPDDEPLFNKRKRATRRKAIIMICCAVALLATVLIYYFVESQKRIAAEIAAQAAVEEAMRLQQEQQQKEFEEMSNSTVFLEGITVNGVAIGNMSMAEARTALSAVQSNIVASTAFPLTYKGASYPLDLKSVVSGTDLDSVLTEAYQLGKTGDYAAMKSVKEETRLNGRAYQLTAVLNSAVLAQRVAELAAKLDTPAKDAGIATVNTETRTITYADEVMGVSVLQNDLVQSVLLAIAAGDLTPIEIPVLETKPVVTRAMVEGTYVMRASATTSFSDSSSNRKYNIRKGAGIISGTVLKPGEVFSTNDTLGTRTAKNGWKDAGAYEGGAVVEQAGGGVCQLSSTLYNAVVKADLEIVYRRNHSMPVTYVDKGLDATINSVGNLIDFQFKNNTANDVVIFAYTVDNKKLTFEVWAVPFATDEYDEIRLSAKQMAVYEPEGEPVQMELPEGTEKYDGTLLQAGETYVAITPRKGYLYQSYKNYYKNGTLVRSEKLASSTYKAIAGEIWVGPALAETPTPTPTAEPAPDPGTGDRPDDGGMGVIIG